MVTMHKLVFSLENYVVFSIVLFCFWGIGQSILTKVTRLHCGDSILDATLSLVVGQGIYIVYLLLLGACGKLKILPITGFLAAALILALYVAYRIHAARRSSIKSDRPTLSVATLLGFGIILIYSLPTLLAPLTPPLPGDELLYHLPHAQQWAINGRITIDEWIRYPWFPSNYELLYASAMTAHSDILPHLFNALAGWLVALIIFRVGVNRFSPGVAFVAALFWIHLIWGEFGRADVDIGLTLYLLTASLALMFWLENESQRAWLYVSTFCIGIALGTKYQAIVFVPLLLAVMIFRCRDRKTLATAALFMLLPSAYWYVRNVLWAGDPIAPMGGKIFGFTDWNLSDYVAQIQDVKKHAEWPNWMLWPAVLTLIRFGRCSATEKKMMVYGVVTFALWLVTSHSPRYLMPAWPVLALLAASQWVGLAQQMWGVVQYRFKPGLVGRRVLQVCLGLVFIVVTCMALARSHRYWLQIATNTAERDAVLEVAMPGFGAFEYARHASLGKTYLVGELSSARYYAPQPVYGDNLGPWRYSDFFSGDPRTLYENLRRSHFDSLIADVSLMANIESQPSFKTYFSVLYQDKDAGIYRLLPAVNSAQ